MPLESYHVVRNLSHMRAWLIEYSITALLFESFHEYVPAFTHRLAC